MKRSRLNDSSEELPYIWETSEERKTLLVEKDAQAARAKKTVLLQNLEKEKAFNTALSEPSAQKRGFLNLLGRTVKKEAHAPCYSIQDFEPMIYNNKHHSQGMSKLSKWLIAPEGIFSVDGGEDNANLTGVFRCFMDWHVAVIDIAMLLCVLLSSMVSPCTFMWGGTISDNRVPDYMLVIDVLLDVFYAIYLALLLNTSYMSPARRMEIVRRDKIVRRYLRSPIYWTMVFSTTTYVWIGAGGPLLLNLVKFVRTVHLIWLPDSMWQMKDTRFTRIVRPIVLLVLTSHWVACLMMPLAGWREQKDRLGITSFATSFDGHKVVSDYMSAYLSAFVEAIYMLTGSLDNPIGDDSTRHRNFGSLIIVSLFGPVGVIIVSVIISVVVQEQTLTYALDIRHVENKAFISRALDNLNIPGDLQARVFSLHYFQKMSHDHEAFSELFKKKNLSSPLECALRIYLYHDSFLHSGYFKDKDTNYILEVVRCLKDCVFLPGDYVTRRGEVGGQMFFIARGVLTVKIPTHRLNAEEARMAAQAPAELQGVGAPPGLKNLSKDIHRAFTVSMITRGDYFGEIALIADCLRTAWVCADSYAILSELKRHAIERIWKYFPEERQILVDAITAKITTGSKAAMQSIWRTAAHKGLNMGKEIEASAKLDDNQGDSWPTPLSPPEANVEELEARYHFALEGTELLEKMNPPLVEVAKTGNIEDLAKRFESFCNTMNRGQEKLQEKMRVLSSCMEELAQSQACLKNSLGMASATISPGEGLFTKETAQTPSLDETKKAGGKKKKLERGKRETGQEVD